MRAPTFVQTSTAAATPEKSTFGARGVEGSGIFGINCQRQRAAVAYRKPGIGASPVPSRIRAPENFATTVDT